MGSRRFLHSANRILAICGAATLLATVAWAASTTKLIYSFAGNGDGEYTDTELVMDSAGNLYGTSVQGGTYGGGTVFQVTPAGVHTVLYDFTGGSDGGEPYKGVTLDAMGNLYGTAVTGGGGSCEGGCGVVFKLTTSGGTWTQTVIHTFTGGNDGSGPGSPVVIDKHGNVYGTTPTGGASGMGVIYQLVPDGGGWKLRVIHTFTGGNDGGGGSASRFLIDAAGSLYGGRRERIRHHLRALTQPGKMEVHDSLCLQGSARRSLALRRRDLRQGGESLRDDVLRRRK